MIDLEEVNYINDLNIYTEEVSTAINKIINSIEIKD